jgi:formiminotetrahydrofolate cyclodeaminase
MALLVHGVRVAEHGNPNAASDAGVALQLAMTAASGAFMNVETNLSGLSDEAYSATTRAEMTELVAKGGKALGSAFTALGWKGHRPPFGGN